MRAVISSPSDPPRRSPLAHGLLTTASGPNMRHLPQDPPTRHIQVSWSRSTATTQTQHRTPQLRPSPPHCAVRHPRAAAEIQARVTPLPTTGAHPEPRRAATYGHQAAPISDGVTPSNDGVPQQWPPMGTSSRRTSERRSPSSWQQGGAPPLAASCVMTADETTSAKVSSFRGLRHGSRWCTRAQCAATAASTSAVAPLRAIRCRA